MVTLQFIAMEYSFKFLKVLLTTISFFTIRLTTTTTTTTTKIMIISYVKHYIVKVTLLR